MTTSKNVPSQTVRGISTFDSFKSSAYRMFFFGMAGMWSSFSMEMVARTYLLYDITGSAAKLGILSLANAVPVIALSLLGGAIADRLPKKRMIIVSQIAMAAVSLLIALAINLGFVGVEHPNSWWILVAGTFAMGIVMAIAMPARQAMIPNLVPPIKIMNAIALNTLGMSAFQLVGPVIAGVVISYSGYATVYYIMTALNASGIIFSLFLPDPMPAPTLGRSVVSNMVDGVKYVFKHRTILLILVLFISSIILAMPYQMLLPVFAKDILDVGVTGQGTMMSVSGFGALAAALILASIPSRKRGITLLAANLVLGLALIVFAFSVSWPLSLCMMVVVGMGQIINNTAGTATIQTYTEPEYLGRVMSIMSMSFGLSSLGAFFAGLLAQDIGAQWAIGGLAIVLVAVSFYMLAFSPKVRKAD
jgi:MFS transporter, DHA1 family, staphyloferrin A biosynthesis exporter